MRLLICTQIMDKNDPIALGFFHRWVEELAKYFEHIDVICLKAGTHTLPMNVHVHSLGKEGGVNMCKYIFRFYRYLFVLRNSYDRVFVHMNPHYILLGGLWWRIAGIPISFWRNHAHMNLMTRIAAVFARKIFYTSPFACTSRYAHAVQMPVGIDLTRFTEKETHREGKIKVLFLGRLSPVKRAEIFIEAGKVLGAEYEMHLYGDDPEEGGVYLQKLKNMAGENIFFHSAIKNELTPDIYRAHDIYVNLTPEGSMDKTVLEAVACGVWVIVTNTSFSKVVSRYSILANATGVGLAEKITQVASISDKEKSELTKRAIQVVAEDHSLEKLAFLLHKYITEKV